MVIEEPADLVFNEPLIMQWMITLVHGQLAPHEVVLINPLLMAGWIGLFLTALNLMPIGQLDGGHILYCLIGRPAHAVALACVVLIVAYMAVAQYWAFSLMLVLLVLMGLRHPPTTNDRAALGAPRIVLGWLTLAFLLIGINPRPLDQRLPELPEIDQPASALSPVNRGPDSPPDQARRDVP